jgi:hypothetical protein
MKTRNLPTFASQTVNAHKRDDNNGFVLAIMGAAIIGASFGTLGVAGVSVALIGAMMSTIGMALLFGQRPLDRTLFQPAKPERFTCNTVTIRDAKSAVVLRVGTYEASAKRAFMAYVNAIEAPTPVLAKALGRSYKASDVLKMERAKWLGEWPLTREPVCEIRARMVASVV